MDKGDAEFESKVVTILNKHRDANANAPAALGVDPMMSAAFASDPGMSYTPPAALGQTTQVLPVGQAERRNNQYEECRRSLRIWPVDNMDLVAGLKSFFAKKLHLDDQYVEGLGHLKAKRHRDPRSKMPHEVIVTFETKEARDAIKSVAKELAPEGRAAGIRLQVPGFLSTNFKLLENLGYQMRAVDPTIRRVIKFDDENQDLMMDVRMGENWKRVRPADALAAKRNKTFVNTSGPADLSSCDIADFFAGATPATGANRQGTGPR